MYYGQATSYCTAANNPMATKDVNLKNIVSYVKPDTFAANFILQGEYIKYGTQHFRYLSGPYKTIGQDGNHFNDAVTDGTNNSAPDSIIDALYMMYDHLPVFINLKANQTVGANELHASNMDVFFPNPVTDYLQLSLITRAPSTLEFSIINLLGKKFFQLHINLTGLCSIIKYQSDHLNKGYIF